MTAHRDWPSALALRLVTTSLTRPRATALVVLVLVMGAALSVRRLSLGGSIYDLFPDRPGPVAAMATYARVFGGNAQLVALVEADRWEQLDEGVRRVGRLLAASPLIRRVRERPGVEDLVQLAESGGIWALVPEELFPEVERRLTTGAEEELRRLRALLSSPLAPDRALLAADPLGIGRLLVDRWRADVVRPRSPAAVIVSEPRGSAGDLEFCRRLGEELDRIAAAMPSGVRVSWTGGYRYGPAMADRMRGDLTRSSVAAMVWTGLCLGGALRALVLIPLAFGLGGLAVLGTLALAAAWGGHLDGLSLAFAAICIGMVVDGVVHLVLAMPAGPDLAPRRRVLTAFEGLMPALMTASATTVAMFAAFGVASFAGLRRLGLLAAVGIALGFVLTLILFPLVYRVLPPRRRPLASGWIDWWAASIAGIGRRRAAPVLGAVALTGGVLWGAGGWPTFSVDLERLVPRDLEPARVDREMAHLFGVGPHRVVALVRGGGLEEVVQAIEALDGAAREALDGGPLGVVESVAPLLPSLAVQRRRLARLDALNRSALAAGIAVAMRRVGLEPRGFAPFFEGLRHPRFVRYEEVPPTIQALTAALLHRGPDEVLGVVLLQPRVDALEAALLWRRAIEARGAVPASFVLTGADLAEAAMGTLLREDLERVAGLVALALLLLLGPRLGSFRRLAAVLLSLLAAAGLFLGTLSLMGRSLDLYSLVVLPLILGYGVDDHIYVAHGLARGRWSGGGRAVVVTTLTTAGGFAALGLCRTEGLRVLGETAVVGVVYAMVAALLVLPAAGALLRAWPEPPAAVGEPGGG